jgi:hypothetical protein
LRARNEDIEAMLGLAAELEKNRHPSIYDGGDD